jgi:hypothetical protein
LNIDTKSFVEVEVMVFEQELKKRGVRERRLLCLTYREKAWQAHVGA